MVADRPQLGAVLVASGRITEEQRDEAVRLQADGDGRRIGEILVDQGAATPKDVAVGLSEQFGLPYIDLRRERPEVTLLELMSEEVARRLNALVVRRVDGRVLVAVADPSDPDLAASIADAVGEPVSLAVGVTADVERVLDQTYRATADVGEFVKVFEAKAPTSSSASPTTERVDDNAPVVQVVSRILSQAVRDRASDVHIEAMGDRVRVRNRVDGALHEVLSLPASMAQALSSRIKIMADLNIVERRRPQDGQFEAVVDGRDLDIRVATTGTVFGEKVVLRILDRRQALYDLEDLGMPPTTGRLYSELIRSPYGMVVCAGPTGSGKTTTLYATLMEIQSDEINVMTVEDPVEYVFPAINQISINEAAGLTFASGLRAILRQDPDSILVGEIRDIETARIAVQAALTGHFVLSTIHATDAASAVHRFVDMGIESFLLASSLLAVVGQRLVRTTCPECKVEYEMTADDQAFYEKAGGQGSGPFVRGEGCSYCSHTGFYGRSGVYEVLRVTDDIRDLLVKGGSVDDIRRTAVTQGMIPMQQQAIDLIDAGDTTVAEVLRTIYVL